MGIGWNATLPFVGVYLAVSRDIPLWIIGISYFATGLTALISQTLGGRLTDKVGPRPVMLIGYSAAVFSALILGYLVTSMANAYTIAAFYPVSAFARGLCQPVPGAIIASTQRDSMMTDFSFLTIGSNLAFAIGPAIGGVLAQYYGYPAVFYFTASVFGLTVLTALASIPRGSLDGGKFEKRLGTNRWLNWSRDRTVILLLALAFVSFLVSGFDIQPLSLYSATFLHISNAQIGYLFSINGLGVVLLQFPVIKLVQRSRRAVIPLIASNLVCIFGFVLAASVIDFFGLEIVMVVLTISEMLLSVPMQTIMAVLSAPETRGTYQGYYSAIQNAGRSMSAFVGPTIFSILIFEPRLSWGVISGVAVLAILGLVVISPKLQLMYDDASSMPR